MRGERGETIVGVLVALLLSSVIMAAAVPISRMRGVEALISG